jgi:hypothetical protein
MLGAGPNSLRYFVMPSFDLARSLVAKPAVHRQLTVLTPLKGVYLATNSLEEMRVIVNWLPRRK